jgi:lincosamide nucleotidyltransferase A/C/D/E
MKKEVVSKKDLFKVLDLFDELKISYWLDGGWGVDVLVGKQTREHRDVDINFDSRYLDEVLACLQAIGYVIETD